ncbi:endo-1,4-beta-xylanase [Jatrophihabitans fulvus]
MLAASASVVAVVLAGCTTPSAEAKRTVVDLAKQDWRRVPGVTADGDALLVARTGRSIVRQDGGERQPDPPVDLAGTHLVVHGNYTLSARFTAVTADATWAVYDSPPVIADEFRIEPPGLRLTLRGHDLRISVFDGSRPKDVTAPRPVHDEHVSIPDPEAVISIRRSGNALAITSSGRTLTSMPLGRVFRSGELWLGLSSTSGSFRVGSFTATAAAGGSLRTARPVIERVGRSGSGLQALAARIRPGFRVGAAVALGPLASDANYAREFAGDFGAITPENAMKAQFLSPRRGVYYFQEADALLAVAKARGMAVHGHTIAFSEAMPRWMRQLPTASATQRRASARALLGYLTTVVKHFKGRLASLDVVNEPFDVDQGTSLQKNVWYRTFGRDYPVVVSKAVHAADPAVKQFVNENGADVPGERQDALLALARRTNALGGHIYGVGLQAHVYDIGTDAVSARELTDTFANVAKAGLHVRISENDVSDDRGTRIQAKQYATVLTTCLRSRTCVAYTTWGVDDRYDWFVDDDGSLQQGHDLLFDRGRPTPAYTAMKRALGG